VKPINSNIVTAMSRQVFLIAPGSAIKII